MTRAPVRTRLHEITQRRARVDSRPRRAQGTGAGIPRFLQPRALDTEGTNSDHQKPVQRQEIEDDEEEVLQGKFDAIQRQEEEEDQEFDDEEPLQGKFQTVQRQEDDEDEEFDEEPLQAKAASSSPGTPRAGPEAAANRTGMPNRLRTGLETLSGVDLSGVRVHRDSPKPAEINAWAYTQGQDIYVGPGQERHLPHEGWHAVQQAQGRVRPTIQAKGVSINDDAALEQEADVMGARALQMMPSGRGSHHQDSQVRLGPAKSTSRPAIQRAMKFEYQIKDPDIKNRVYRDDGTHVLPLPRKYGPEDYLAKGESGVRLESETHGQLEFETGWSRNWFKLGSQIAEARLMTELMNGSKSDDDKVVGSDGKKYRPFPFAATHLRAGQGFRTRRRSNLWKRRQRTGKAKVRSRRLKVKPMPRSRSRTIDRLSKHDVVDVLERGRRWSRIEKGKITGWVRSKYLRTIYKRYESNVNKYGPDGTETEDVWSRDTILKDKEQLLLDVQDENWTAYIQVSESFSLDQFESFMKQFGHPDDVDPVFQQVGDTMSSFNPNKPAPPEIMPDDTSVDLVLKYTTAAAGNLVSDIKFANQSSGLRNLLLMVFYYIRRGAGNLKTDEPEKWAFPLMSRTNFGSIYKSLSKDEQRIFKKMVYDRRRGILATLGLTRETKWYTKGKDDDAKIPSLTVYDWLKGITRGRDRLSGGGFSGAMGRFRIEREKKSQKGLIRFESRESEYLKPASKWIDHAFNLFLTAMQDRPRDSGKGGTGLKRGWKDWAKALRR